MKSDEFKTRASFRTTDVDAVEHRLQLAHAPIRRPMSLAVFENFLKFAEVAIAAKAGLPTAIDAGEFESALVNYGVVLLHAHMEQCLRSEIELRCRRCADLEVRAFALSVRDEKTGRIGVASLKDTLRRFSDACRTAFHTDLQASGRGDSWESIKNQRITVAHHGQPVSCSLV